MDSPNSVRAELHDLIAGVRNQMAYQQALGVPGYAAKTLEDVREELGDCTRCPLHAGRTQIVFGVGNPHADIMFVGEAPGHDEDVQGEPFVGRAGKLLTDIIEKGMGLTRADVYIANVIKCRPPDNRNPKPEEILQCEPFLKEQIRVIRPKIIVALGSFAAQTLLRTNEKISSLRGRFHEYEGIPLMATYHTAFLLRSPAKKREVWQDIQQVMAKADLPLPRQQGR